MIKSGGIQKVVYIMPDDNKSRMVEKALKSIKSVTITADGQKRNFPLNDSVWKWFEFKIIR